MKSDDFIQFNIEREEKIFRTTLFSKIQLNWGKKNLRDFPWRNELDNFFKVFCTEVLLQKSLAENVEKIYADFFNEYSSFQEIERTNISKLKEIIKPTGLYNKKAKSLIESAKYFNRREISKNVLLELKENVKGISDYVVNSTICFHFGGEVELIDVNIRKIFSLINVNDQELLKKILRSCVKNFSKSEIRTFYFSLLDLGAEIRKGNELFLTGSIPIVSIDSYSYKNLRSKNIYWRFKGNEFKRGISLIAFYRTSPIQSITNVGFLKEIDVKESTVIYNIEKSLKVEPEIKLKDGNYPATSYKYSKLYKLLTSKYYSQT